MNWPDDFINKVICPVSNCLLVNAHLAGIAGEMKFHPVRASPRENYDEPEKTT